METNLIFATVVMILILFLAMKFVTKSIKFVVIFAAIAMFFLLYIMPRLGV